MSDYYWDIIYWNSIHSHSHSHWSIKALNIQHWTFKHPFIITFEYKNSQLYIVQLCVRKDSITRLYYALCGMETFKKYGALGMQMLRLWLRFYNGFTFSIYLYLHTHKNLSLSLSRQFHFLLTHFFLRRRHRRRFPFSLPFVHLLKRSCILFPKSLLSLSISFAFFSKCEFFPEPKPNRIHIPFLLFKTSWFECCVFIVHLGYDFIWYGFILKHNQVKILPANPYTHNAANIQ